MVRKDLLSCQNVDGVPYLGLALYHKARRFRAVAAVQYPERAASIASDVEFGLVVWRVGTDLALLPALVAEFYRHCARPR